MNQEILENLLIDRALGQLSPDVAALLDDYLAHNPAAAELATTLDDTVALASNILKPLPHPIKPATDFKVVRFPTPVRLTLAMAASFAVGIGITFLAVQGLRPVSPTDSQPRIAEQPATKPSPTPSEYAHASPEARSLPFWSRERAYLLAQNREAARQ